MAPLSLRERVRLRKLDLDSWIEERKYKKLPRYTKSSIRTGLGKGRSRLLAGSCKMLDYVGGLLIVSLHI